MEKTPSSFTLLRRRGAISRGSFLRCVSHTLLIPSPSLWQADGFTYERKAIEKWLEDHDTSPKTGARLASKMLFPNQGLRAILREVGMSVGHRERMLLALTTRPDAYSTDGSRAVRRPSHAFRRFLHRAGRKRR